MSTSSIENEIRIALSGVGVKVSKDVLHKCASISKNRNISPSQLATSWEMHSLNNQVDELTPQTFPSFQSALLSSKKITTSSYNDGIVSPTPMKRGAVINRPPMAKRSNPNNDFQSPKVKRKVDFDTQLEHVVANDGKVHSPSANQNTRSTISPGASSNSSAIVTPSKNTNKDTAPEEANAYGNRTNAGQVVMSYNPQKLDPISTSSAVDITQPFGTVGEFKYMTDKDRSSALNYHLVSFQKKMCEQELQKQRENVSSDDEFTFENIGVPHTGSQFNVGRICNEAHEGKMNETSILIEGSKVGSSGARITLDTKNIKNFSLFPGQIVGVKGINSSGRKMIAEEIVEGIDTKTFSSCEDDFNTGVDIKVTETGIKIVSVVGPYTSGQDLKYEPLMDLLNFVMQEQPSVVIMMGPFVDMRQELVKNEDELILEYELEDEKVMKKHVSYETFFASMISQELEALYTEFPDMNTKFVLVPSLDDAISEPIYPQPPLKDTLPEGGKALSSIPETHEIPFGSLCLEKIERPGHPSDRRVHLVSNPATIKVNEVTIGITSTDALLHVSNEMFSKGLPPGTRICRLAEHFIKQQSYYPLFPPPADEVPLDVTLRSAYSMPVQPDILLLPSKVMNFVKEVADGTTVVNPGYLVKGNKGGTFSVIDIYPPKDNVETNERKGRHSDLKERIRVEIRRI